MAGAILDNARGDVLGDKTYGEGSIQKTIDLQDGGALILSVAKYYTPGGKAIEDAAITPNVLVADKTDDFIAPEDSDIVPDETEKAWTQKGSARRTTSPRHRTAHQAGAEGRRGRLARLPDAAQRQPELSA